MMFDFITDETWEGLARLTMALLLGGAIGIDREMLRKGAGLRTMIIVALGAALFALIGERLIGHDAEITKVIAGVAGGVGFIGAGTIIEARGEVRGITTAASIWLTAAVGMACGFGQYGLAVPTTVLGVIVLWLFRALEPPIDSAGKQRRRRERKRDNQDE